MIEDIEKYVKRYYNLNKKGIVKSKLPSFIKIKGLENLRTEFCNDSFAKIRLSSEEYKEIVENIDYLIKQQKNQGFFGKITMQKLLLTKSK